jgi:hypothetical protein
MMNPEEFRGLLLQMMCAFREWLSLGGEGNMEAYKNLRQKVLDAFENEKQATCSTGSNTTNGRETQNDKG